MNEYCKKWGLDPNKLPKHVGIVMDGNGRWASQKKRPRLFGHNEGVKRVEEITEFSGNIGIEALTLFAFSDENWRRPEEEVSGLMGLLRWFIRKESKRIFENNVRFRVIGDRQKLSLDILDLIVNLEQKTSSNTGMHLCVALSYGGHGEILRAVKKIVAKVEVGEVFVNDIDSSLFESCLDTAGLPALDMFIRTSGEFRVSNFLLWQLAYAEMFFEPAPWPDFNMEKYVHLLNEFSCRQRRFGLTPEQKIPPTFNASKCGLL